MKHKTLSLSTVLGFLGLVLLLHSMNSNASSPSISCKTAFGEKSFVIEDSRISFVKEDDASANRSISSVSADSVRTHSRQNGFTKTLYIDGLKHKINVKNVNSFSDVDDYLSITSPKGHEMTYPLSCQSV